MNLPCQVQLGEFRKTLEQPHCPPWLWTAEYEQSFCRYFLKHLLDYQLEKRTLSKFFPRSQSVPKRSRKIRVLYIYIHKMVLTSGVTSHNNKIQGERDFNLGAFNFWFEKLTESNDLRCYRKRAVWKILFKYAKKGKATLKPYFTLA